jgi:hypothetical protein
VSSGCAPSREDEDPESALLGRQHPPRPLQAPLRGRVVNQSPRPGTIKRRNFPVKLAVGRG